MSTELETRTPIADGMRRLRESLEASAVLSNDPIIPGFISIEQFAVQVDVTLSTARRWKRQGYGPKFIKIGRRDYCKDTAASDFAAQLLAEAEEPARRRRRR